MTVPEDDLDLLIRRIKSTGPVFTRRGGGKMNQQTVAPVDPVAGWLLQTTVPNGALLFFGIMAVAFVLVVIIVFIITLVIIARAEANWNKERDYLLQENANLAADVEAWRNHSNQLAMQTPSYQNCQSGGQGPEYRKVKKMSTIRRAQQIIGEVGLLRGLTMLSLIVVLAAMAKTTWERIRYHFEDNGG